MNEREWLRIAGEALQSLKRIEKTVSEPQTLSAHRIAANRKISEAVNYINFIADRETYKEEELPEKAVEILTYHKITLSEIKGKLLGKD